MKTYASKEELITEIQGTYQKFMMEFDDVPEDLRDKRIEGVDRTPSELLSYQLGWVNLLLSWDKDEKNGIEVQTPTTRYKWNNLGGLYQSFYETYGNYSLEEQRNQLDNAVNTLCTWIGTLSAKELNKPGQRGWATTKAMWPVWRWVHINTVAPFKGFRTKIRKWKKFAC